jgi:glutathione S-transferase
LQLAGVDFEDVRVKMADWPAVKATTPFGAVPVFELPGRPPLAHSNAILTLIGRKHDLHPKDEFVAAQHEAIMCHVEDMRIKVSATMQIKDEADKRAAREALASGYLLGWAQSTENQISDDGPFFAGGKIHVVDLKVYMAVRWIASGNLDHIPATTFAAYPKLNRVHDAVRDHAVVKAWYARA